MRAAARHELSGFATADGSGDEGPAGRQQRSTPLDMMRDPVAAGRRLLPSTAYSASQARARSGATMSRLAEPWLTQDGSVATV